MSDPGISRLRDCAVRLAAGDLAGAAEALGEVDPRHLGTGDKLAAIAGTEIWTYEDLVIGDGGDGARASLFQTLRSLIELQNEGRPERLLAVKYPYTAHVLVRQILDEAAGLAREGPVKVVFIEGFPQTVNPMTGGFIDRLFRDRMPAGVEYHRFVARPEMRDALPTLPGGLPLIEDRLRVMIPESFLPEVDPGLFR
jgi:hypothetical protein